EFKDSLVVCSTYLSRTFKTLIYFPFLGDMQSISEYLKSNNLSFKERLKIQSHFNQKKMVRGERDKILSLMKQGAGEKALENPQERQNFFDETSSLKLSFWKNLLNLHVSIKAKNLPWAESLKKKVIKGSPYALLVKGLSFSDEEEILVRDYILKVFEEYVSTFQDEEGGKMLGKYISDVVDTNDFRLVSSRLNSDWSLTQIRDNMKNPIQQLEYFDFWFLTLMNRSSEVEVKSRFREFLNPAIIQKASPGQCWVFEYFFPVGKELRQVLSEKLLDLWNKGTIQDRYIVLRVISNEKVKKFLARNDENFKRADFQLQREFFKEVLSTGLSTSFALFQLSKLGNKDENDLWWVMI
ncbi:unnamed protein product, partial [Chrysoparadoxa australica]